MSGSDNLKRKKASQTKLEHQKRTRITNVVSSDDEIQMICWRPANYGKKIIEEPHTSISHPSLPRPSGSQPSGPQKHHIVIDLTAEDDVPRQRSCKRAKLSEPKTVAPIYIIDSDNEEPRPAEDSFDDDYENIHHGFNIGWTIDAPELADDVSGVDSVEAAIAQLSLNRIHPSRHPNLGRLEKVSVVNSGLSHAWQTAFTYDLPPTFFPLVKPWQRSPIYLSYSGGRSRTGFLEHRPPCIQTPLTRLTLREEFKMADACHSICQSSGKVLVTSATPGGIDEEDESGNREFSIDPYNTPDTLAVWIEGGGHKFVQGHSVNSNDSGGVGSLSRTKYYDVKCARFDPHDSNIFISTGLDGVLTIWDAVSTENERPRRYHGASSDILSDENIYPNFQPVKRWGRELYRHYSCHDIVFRPDKHPKDITYFAAPCEDGLFVHSYMTNKNGSSPSQFTYRCLRPKLTDNRWSVGATVWGTGLTSSEIFVCSESTVGVKKGFVHGAFDIDTGRFLYSFDDHRHGEELALDPAGDALALFTSEESDLHLGLYDVRRHEKRHTNSIKLPATSLSDDFFPEVNTAHWSPDGILLAVSKNDNMAHLYDVRCLERGPLLDFSHKTSADRSPYGITVMSWITEIGFRTPNLGLVTGGGDHKFCLWDVKTACEEPRVIAELEWGVSVGHLGDLSKGEKPLVAGDIHGNVYIYEFGNGEAVL